MENWILVTFLYIRPNALSTRFLRICAWSAENEHEKHKGAGYQATRLCPPPPPPPSPPKHISPLWPNTLHWILASCLCGGNTARLQHLGAKQGVSTPPHISHEGTSTEGTHDAQL